MADSVETLGPLLNKANLCIQDIQLILSGASTSDEDKVKYALNRIATWRHGT